MLFHKTVDRMKQKGSKALITFTKNGPYCSIGDFYIDPYKGVKNALITHAHADHARWGMQNYLSHFDNEGIMRHRISKDIQFQGVNYKEKTYINGVEIAFYPSGHIPGASMILLTHKGEKWCFSGDYKTENDGLSIPIEIPLCHHFITECTFGLPVFNWAAQTDVFESIKKFINMQFEAQKSVLITAYSLGKAQRLLYNLKAFKEHTVVHPSINSLNTIIKSRGYDIADDYAEKRKGKHPVLVILPPSASQGTWTKQFSPFELTNVSGWMAIRGNKRRQNIAQGFILSDHADFKGLIKTVEATQATHIYTTHGYTEVFAKYLREEKGLEATDLHVASNYDQAED